MYVIFTFLQIVFSEAWWIGNKDENPEEVRLEFPKEMNMASLHEKLLLF